jgi:hypothetical protein
MTASTSSLAAAVVGERDRPHARRPARGGTHATAEVNAAPCCEGKAYFTFFVLTTVAAGPSLAATRFLAWPASLSTPAHV